MTYRYLACLALFALVVSCSDDAGADANNLATDAGVTSDAMDDQDADDDAGPGYGDPFTVNVFDDVRISSIREDEFFQKATMPVDFSDGPYERVMLKVQLDTTCFPFSEWTPPPEGHNWPVDCDAFDRNFEFVLDPALEEGDAPGFELVRAITPFGGPKDFEVDITDLANARPGAHELKASITTWPDRDGIVSGSEGGWNVTADVEFVPGPPPRDVVAAVPLYNGNQRADTGLVSIDVAIPEEATRARVEYRVTGHGGTQTNDPDCIGGADEFCRRTHYVTVLGVPQMPFVPWRDDCDQLCTLTREGANFQYCAENPCGAIQSVRAPRANWCPGDVTPPYEWEIDNLAEAGSRPFEFSVEGIGDGGSWRTSATAYFYR